MAPRVGRIAASLCCMTEREVTVMIRAFLRAHGDAGGNFTRPGGQTRAYLRTIHTLAGTDRRSHVFRGQLLHWWYEERRGLLDDDSPPADSCG